MANWTTFLFVSFSFPLFFCTVSLQLSTTLIENWGGQKTDPNCISHRDAAEAQLGVCLWCSAGSGWTHPLSASCLMRSNTRTGHMDPRCVLARGSPDSEPAETLSEGGTGNLCPFSTFRNLGMLTSGVSWSSICTGASIHVYRDAQYQKVTQIPHNVFWGHSGFKHSFCRFFLS